MTGPGPALFLPTLPSQDVDAVDHWFVDVDCGSRLAETQSVALFVSTFTSSRDADGSCRLDPLLLPRAHGRHELPDRARERLFAKWSLRHGRHPSPGRRVHDEAFPLEVDQRCSSRASAPGTTIRPAAPTTRWGETTPTADPNPNYLDTRVAHVVRRKAAPTPSSQASATTRSTALTAMTHRGGEASTDAFGGAAITS